MRPRLRLFATRAIPALTAASLVMAAFLQGAFSQSAPSAPPAKIQPKPAAPKSPVSPAASAAPASQKESQALGPLATRLKGGGAAVSLSVAQPVVRVGLTTDPRRIVLSSAGGFHLVDPKTGRDLWRRTHRGDLRVVLEHRDGAPAPRFRVQIASLSDSEEAEALRQRVETETGEVATVTFDPDRRTYRVRAGQAPSRDAVAVVEEKIRAMGFAETWIVEETAIASKRVRLRLVDEDYNDLLIEPKTILALPAVEGKPLAVDGQKYRGAVEIVMPGLTRLRAVNIVNLEEYLRGVVPHELGPSLYPELEALKAQTIAARTYAYANRGQFAADGYDLCDTPRCQVYKGMEGEDALTDRAIDETAGLILTFEGQLIHALYTATCGGHTEDGSNVFREEKGPYLKGVDCYADETVLTAWRRNLFGAQPPPPILLPSGERIEEELALLAVLGLLDPKTMTPDAMEQVTTSTEMAESARRALALCGKSTALEPLPQGAYPTVADLSRYLVAAFGWQERVAYLLDPRDLASLLGGGSLLGGSADGGPESAYLIKEGILPPRLASGDTLLAPATRGLTFRALHRLLVRHEATSLREAIFRGSRGAALILVPSKDEQKGLLAAEELEILPGAFLSREGAGSNDLVSELSLVPGDRIAYHATGGKIDFLRQKANLRGASDDRFTTAYQWEVRYSREELQEKIRERASIGQLIDVVPGKRGVSGRVLDVTVVGTAGRFPFRGFGIRTLLGLRENLFVIDRQKDTDGRVKSFVFTGKGWGHGVGLCQVGAFGRAMRGERYDEILNHYYAGVRIEPIPPL